MRLLHLTLAFALCSCFAFAGVIQTTGANSSVTTVNGSAFFEDRAALFANPYSEGGMVFSRSGLTFNNNSCGFAGCPGFPGFAGFAGNYMYGMPGTGSGYFDIAAGSGTEFQGLELVVGSGYLNPSIIVDWWAYDDTILVGSGSVTVAPGTIIGFNDPTGFDVLRYSGPSPAFDTVNAQFSSSPSEVPEPATFLFAAGGLAVLGLSRRLARR